MVRSTLAVDPCLHIFRQLHCFVAFGRSASHGFSGSAGVGLPKSSLVPSGVVMLVTVLPAFSACSTSLWMLGLRGLRSGLAGFAGGGYLRALISWTSRYSAFAASPLPQNASSSGPSGSRLELVAPD